MQIVSSSWLNLEKTISKPENETVQGTNDHLLRLKFSEYCLEKMKNFVVEEGDRKHKSQ